MALRRAGLLQLIDQDAQQTTVCGFRGRELRVVRLLRQLVLSRLAVEQDLLCCTLVQDIDRVGAPVQPVIAKIQKEQSAVGRAGLLQGEIHVAVLRVDNLLPQQRRSRMDGVDDQQLRFRVRKRRDEAIRLLWIRQPRWRPDGVPSAMNQAPSQVASSAALEPASKPRGSSRMRWRRRKGGTR